MPPVCTHASFNSWLSKLKKIPGVMDQTCVQVCQTWTHYLWQCGPVLLSLHISRHFIPQFSSNAIPWSYQKTRRPLLLSTHTNSTPVFFSTLWFSKSVDFSHQTPMLYQMQRYVFQTPTESKQNSSVHRFTLLYMQIHSHVIRKSIPRPLYHVHVDVIRTHSRQP